MLLKNHLEKLQDRKLVLLIVLSIAAAVSLAHGILKPVGPKSKSESMHQAESIVREISQFTQSQHLVERRVKRGNNEKWNRDPFQSPYFSAELARNDFVLQGIAWDEKNPQALIGDEIYSAGGRVEGNITVKAIKKQSVILTNGEMNLELKLGE